MWLMDGQRFWPASDSQTQQEDVVYMHLDNDFLVLVTTYRIQIWTGGQHRVKLGTYTRSADSLRLEGLNKKAYWSSSKKSLAILVIHCTFSCTWLVCHISQDMNDVIVQKCNRIEFITATVNEIQSRNWYLVFYSQTDFWIHHAPKMIALYTTLPSL